MSGMTQAEIDPAVLARVQSLHDQGLYRQALAAGEQAWGPVRGWRAPEPCLLGSRIAYQLGLFRTSAAMVLAAWRRHRQLPVLQHAAIRVLLNSRGPFAALRAWQRTGERLATDDQTLQADWLALRGILYGAYRDWDRAWAMIEQASDLGGDGREFDLERAWLFQQQDLYDESLAAIETAARTPGRLQRASIQRTATIYEILGRADDAIAILQDAVASMESVDVGMQLYGLLIDRERYAEADACLKRVEDLLPETGKWLGESIRAARFQSLYQQGDIAGAVAVLDGTRNRYFRTVRENLLAAPAGELPRLLDVPFIRQHHMTCAPATFAAISRFHGRPVDHLELAAQICYDGTPALQERRWISGNGWAVREFELNLDNVRALIDAGCPVGFVTVEPGSAHMQAIIGYDTRRGIYLLRDPFQPRVQEILIGGAHEAYAASGPRCMVFVPPERADWLASVPLKHADLYDHYYALQAALDSHDRDGALAALAQLERKSPGHRLALWGRRSVASYDNDLFANLAAVDQLLAQFPEDLNLLVGRARLLGELGKQRERLAFLDACRTRGIEHTYLLQELADLLAQDHRRAHETRQLLAVILRRHPTSAAALWTLAGVHWELGEREQAFDFYRLCMCLEDKIEGYADTYFRAARFLRQGDDAMAYLQRRVQLLGVRSPNPFITLSRAFDLSGRAQDARDALENALQVHPRDAWLVAEAIDMLLAVGEDARAEAVLSANGDALQSVMRLLKQAAIADFRGDASAQLALYEQVLAQQPRHQGAIVNIAAILARRESPEAAIAFLDSHLDENPFNYWLMREKLGHVVDLPLEAQGPHLLAMAERHPDDPRLLSARAVLAKSQGRHGEALELVERAIHIDPDEAWLYRRYGDLLVSDGRVDSAREALRKAIFLSVDADGVFEALLSTYTTFEGRRDALAFIHAQLMEQVSFGNGILEFQQLARRYLEDARVAQFLEDAVRLRPDLWQSWAALARFRLELNEPAAALLAAGTAVARFPLVPRVWMDRAAVHRVRGDTAAAAEDLRQALAINPRFVEASTQLIDLLESLGDSDAALAELDRAQRLAPRHAPFHAYRAESLWRRGEQQAAIDILVDALRLWPLYGWAWSTLLSWCAVTADAARPRDLARELCATHPGSGVLWQRQSEVTDDVNEKAALLDQALACDPRSTSFLLARCGLLAEQGHVVEARALIDRSFAGGEKPTEILGYEAWLLARTGRRVDAIAAMEKVVAADPAYYRGWQLLAQWYSEERKRDDTLRAARALVRLYPQSPVALVAAAEHFLAQAGDDKALIAEAREYLERALRQQHNDNYLFLTLVDLYFDEGDVAAIRMLFDRHIVDESDIYVRARHVRLLLAEKRVADALDAWVAFLADVPDNDWMLFAPYQWFVDAGEGVGARKRLSPMAADAATAPAIARLWMRAMLDESADQPNRLVADMRKARSAAVPAFWESALAWLVSQRGERTQAASALLYAFGKELPALPRVWPALVYAAIDADNLSEVRRLTTHVFPEAPARALYFCSMAWRAVGNQERARQLAELAVTRPADDSRDNLRFWQEFDAVCHGSGHVRADVLAGLDLRELTRTERLVYDLLLALPLIPEDTTGLSLRALRATVLAVMLSNAGASRNPVARHACLQVKGVFARRDRSSGVLRLWRLLGWQWVFRAPRPAQEAGRAG